MLPRNAGLPSQSLSSALRRDGETAPSNVGGGGPVPTQRALPGNLLDPRDLPTIAAEQVVVGDQYLLFTLLDRELAIQAEYIQSVERLADVTPVPNVAAWVRGVINLRGAIASVVDLRAFLGQEVLPHNPRTRLLSVMFNDMVIGLVVDSVSEMVPIPPSAIQTGASGARQPGIPQWLAPYAAGSVLLGTRNIVLLDVSRVLFSDKMQRYS